MQIEIVADITCPWCFIGKRRLERALAMRPEIAATRSWRAFRLNPNLPRDGVPREVFVAAKFGGTRAENRFGAIVAAGRAEGIDFAFDRIRRVPNTLLTHRLIRLAAAEGCSDAIVEALFRAYFTSGVDIGDNAAVVRIASQNGIDPRRAAAYLDSEAGTAEVLAEEQRARRLGIRAVPCFIIERGYAISGAQEPEMLLPLFDLATCGGNSGVTPS